MDNKNRKMYLMAIKPPKFRPSVVHRAFKKKVTSTPLAVRGINNCSASDPCLSPIRNNESVASGSKKKDNFIPESQTAIRTRKSGQSTDSLNNTYLKNNECDTDINHDKSKSNNKTIIMFAKIPYGKKSTLAPPEPLIDTCEGAITGLRRSSRTRRAPSRKCFPVIILNDVSKSEQKFWTGLVCHSKYENYSTITTFSSIIKTNMKKNQRQTTSGNGRKSVQFSIHKKDIDHHKKSINKRKSKKKESVDGSLDKSKPKKKRGKYSVANDPAETTSTVPNDQPPATPVHNANIANKSPPNNNTKTRKYRSKTFLANDVAETNTSMENYSQSNEREQAAILDTQVDTNKKPKQLAVVNEREMNHDSYQYIKTANSSKYISSDSGRSTLMKSSIDENIKTGRICKGTRKRKVARSVQNRPKSLATKVDEVAKDTNNVDGIDGKYIEVYSESGIHKLKYSEENPKFNQHCDNLKYSDPLDHINGASMVHLEIPPGEIKRKHTNKKHNLFYVVIEGRGRVFVQDEVCGLKKKSGFLIPTGLCYSIVNDSSDETLSLTCVKMPI